MLDEEPEIELLLLDINMPVMDGLTLLSELRERQSAVRAIIVSAYGDMANLRTAMNRGAFDFVTKPVDLNDLEITIRKTLDEITRMRELEGRRAAAERARANLARYFSPNLVEMLAERDEPLGAVRRETVAVLFVDIVGFTHMAEHMAPEAVVTMLRQFHDRMTAQIFACGGTVEKYIGDEIFAVFGLPEASPEDGRLERRTGGSGRSTAGDRRWHQLRAGRDRRCRQRTESLLHRHWRYGQYCQPIAGANPQPRNATCRRRRSGRRSECDTVQTCGRVAHEPAGPWPAEPARPH